MGERLPFPDADTDCIATAEAQHRAEQALEELNVQGWTVVQQGEDADGSIACATISTFDAEDRTIILGSTPGPQSAEAQVARRLANAKVAADGCIGDRRVARTTAERVLRDLGLTDWVVKVSDDSWDANARWDHPEPETVELCAAFDLEEHTVFVNSVLHEREPGWRRFVPGM